MVVEPFTATRQELFAEAFEAYVQRGGARRIIAPRLYGYMDAPAAQKRGRLFSLPLFCAELLLRRPAGARVSRGDSLVVPSVLVLAGGVMMDSAGLDLLNLRTPRRTTAAPTIK